MSSNSKTCRYGLDCKRPDCIYSHPHGRPKRCPQARNCKKFGCELLHFEDRKGDCRHGKDCHSEQCPFVHPKSRRTALAKKKQGASPKIPERRASTGGGGVECKFGAKCLSSACTFPHPEGRKQPCTAFCPVFGCDKLHPKSRRRDCIHGAACFSKVCEFRHPENHPSTAQGNLFECPTAGAGGEGGTGSASASDPYVCPPGAYEQGRVPIVSPPIDAGTDAGLDRKLGIFLGPSHSLPLNYKKTIVSLVDDIPKVSNLGQNSNVHAWLLRNWSTTDYSTWFEKLRIIYTFYKKESAFTDQNFESLLRFLRNVSQHIGAKSTPGGLVEFLAASVDGDDEKMHAHPTAYMAAVVHLVLKKYPTLGPELAALQEEAEAWVSDGGQTVPSGVIGGGRRGCGATFFEMRGKAQSLQLLVAAGTDVDAVKKLLSTAAYSEGLSWKDAWGDRALEWAENAKEGDVTNEKRRKIYELINVG